VLAPFVDRDALDTDLAARGLDYMHAMIGSTFINRIGAGKQLGDTLAVASIPVLSELDKAGV